MTASLRARSASFDVALFGSRERPHPSILLAEHHRSKYPSCSAVPVVAGVEKIRVRRASEGACCVACHLNRRNPRWRFGLVRLCGRGKVVFGEESPSIGPLSTPERSPRLRFGLLREWPHVVRIAQHQKPRARDLCQCRTSPRSRFLMLRSHLYTMRNPRVFGVFRPRWRSGATPCVSDGTRQKRPN